MIEYKTKVDIIYDILIDNISKGVYKAGERLVISQISKDNHISDIPVREAIRRLESEGYVQIHPNQGAVISEFTRERLIEIFQIKAVLEGYAARLSVDYITPRDIRELQNINNQLAKALEEGNHKKYSQLNIRFHLRIYECMPQKKLYGMIQDLWKKYSITQSVFSLAPKCMTNSIQEHKEIIRLLEEKKADELELVMRRHKMRAGHELTMQLERLEKQNLQDLS